MRAVTLRGYGGPEVLSIDAVADPRPPAGWVVVELRAAALNWHDCLVRRGQYPRTPPVVPGADGAGVRRDTGEEVVILPSLGWGTDDRAPAEGFEILGDRTNGTHAELVAVPEENVVRRPRGWSWGDAAALPLVGLTAHRALFRRGGLRSGDRVLVLGAGGGVATTTVALAARSGARVAVTSSTREAIDTAVALGADGGVSYEDADWPMHARDAFAPEGFDLVIDPVGSWEPALAALRPGGRLVTFGAKAADRATVAIRPFYFAQASILGTTMGSPRDFADLLAWVERNPGWRPLVDRVLPLDRIADAHRALEAGGVRGKVVLEAA